MTASGSKRDALSEHGVLLSKVKQREESLRALRRDLDGIDHVIKSLHSRQRRYELLGEACGVLEELESAGGSDLLWKEQDPALYLQDARQQINKHTEALEKATRRRDELLAEISDEGLQLEYLKFDLDEAREREAARANRWLIEREPNGLPQHEFVMPWARGAEEDRRLRGVLVLTIIAASVLSVLINMIAIPAAERPKQVKLPERMARLVREERAPPPPPIPIEEPAIEEEIPEPEPEPELADAESPTEIPETSEQPEVAVLSEQEVKEKVKTKGILAFRESIASRAALRTTAQLGSQARVRAVDDEAISRPQRSMVSSSAPGLDGGINLADISRDVVGSGEVASVELARVASSIDTDGAVERPLASAALAGRTDEDIQIVFDRYKAALYRLYNRELRKDSRLRGQIVLKLTIEPDGSVSSCVVQSSSMNAPQLEAQVIDRVRRFDFGPREDIEAMTIIYPIDFMPAT